MYENKWIYNGKEFESEDIENYIGFVYKITNTITNEMYIGKKIFHTFKRKQVKGKSKKIKIESDWKDYYGSSEEFSNDVLTYGKESFKREILHLCISKSVESYYEMKEIFTRDALIDPQYKNCWVSCRINRKNLKGIMNESECKIGCSKS